MTPPRKLDEQELAILGGAVHVRKELLESHTPDVTQEPTREETP
jgi:hypothetical protein